MTIVNVTSQFLSWYDYILFSLMLLISTIIGIYFGRKQSTASEYLMGGKTMKPWIITISLIASHISGLSILGLPADAYRFGGTYLLGGICMSLVILATIYLYLPVFYNLQITSLYEYLEMRFDNRTKLLVSSLYVLYSFLILPIVIYAAALAASTVTGFDIDILIPLVCCVCIFYTSIGGLKAVIWTDAFQFTITFGTIAVVFILGIKSAGGLTQIWRIAVNNKRLDMLNFELDLTSRDSFWTVVFGLTFIWMSNTSVYQTCTQKFLAVPTLNGAKFAVIFYGIGVVLVKAICVLIGLTIYANYSDCDPFTIKQVRDNDQLVPYFVMEIAKTVPGLAGVFTAGIISSGLSGLSANLNCLAGTIYVDFLARFFTNISEKTKCRILKLIVVLTGLTCLGMTFVIKHLGGIIPLTITFQAITNGPILGIFTLGLFVPRANAKAAFYSAIMGLISISSIVIPSKYYQSQGYIQDFAKPISTKNCLFLNETFVPVLEKSLVEPFFLFRISYFYYAFIGAFVTFIAGVVISYTTNYDKPVDKKLITSVAHFLITTESAEKKNKTPYKNVETALKNLKNLDD